jgi:uncharacterized protein YbjT (DUF2867 family)
MKRHTALLAGASGLVGGECLRLLLADDRYESVVVLTRRDLGAAARHPKAQQLVVDLAEMDSVGDRLRAEHVFCTLGTTIRKAGSQEKFREVDCAYPSRLAAITRRNEARHFSVVSALGAHPSSPFFYSRVKGEMEDALRRLGWPSLAIFRPSLIAGDRAEPRPLERFAEHVLRFAPAHWRPVTASSIAAAMVETAVQQAAGVTVIESRNINAATQSKQDEMPRRPVPRPKNPRGKTK